MGRATIIIAAACLAACHTENVVAPAAPPADGLRVGTYTMRSVNGATLPALAGYDGSTAIDVLSGSVELNADQSFVMTSNVRTRGLGGVQIHADTVRGQFWYFGDMVVLQHGTDEYAWNVLSVTDSRTLRDDDLGAVYQR